MQIRRASRAGVLGAVIVRLDAALRAWDGASVRVHDLARAGGVSPRTLHRVFARHYGAPPIAHLRRERLRQVRQSLLAAGPGDTVTSVAFDWGFSHLGRFAAFYETCFGERPSETLRRGRAIGRLQAAPAA
jgi:transcriptional regulator GlxA family with amidase domain